MQSCLRNIVLFFLALSLYGCSLARVGYDYAPQLTWWWLDGYIGFDKELEPAVKKAINNWYAWHRTAQLPEYAKKLAKIRSQIDGSLTAAQVCSWVDDFQNTIKPAFAQAAQQATPVVLQLGETQLRQLAQSYAESNDKHRREYLQPDLEERYEESLERTIDRVENLYGEISEKQREFIENSLKQSPFDPEARLKERQQQQQKTLKMLHQLVMQSIPVKQTESMLRSRMEHMFRSDDADYRAYQLKLSQYSCNFVASLHNSTIPKQRLHIQEQLKEWEEDMRELAK